MEIVNLFGIVKSLHIIFVVTWFAALFYIVRLFVYHAEAQDKSEPERSILTAQYSIMEWRLWYIIGWPSMILALIFGVWMLYLIPGYLAMGFMHVKLGLVGLLVVYHFYCHSKFKQLQAGLVVATSTSFRFLNEVATLLLIAIVFVIVLKSTIDWIWGVVGIMGVAVLLMFAIRAYKKRREKNDKK